MSARDTAARPRSIEDLGIARKPFYTVAEVAAIVGVSDQTILDRIHAPGDDPRYLYAVALGPRTYRIPVGALSQLVGIAPRITYGTRPLRIDDAERAELARPSARRSRR